MESLWEKTVKLPQFPALKEDIKTDVLIIGGGMAGILTAYMLKQAGVDCILLEAHRLCGGVTGKTTAKITSQHGLIYCRLIKEYGVEPASMYLKSNEEALAEYQKLCKNIDCDFRGKSAYVYACESILPLENELEALEKIGFKGYDFCKNLPINIENVGGIQFHNQAEFNPLKFLSNLLTGLNIYENTKVKGWNGKEFITDGGKVTAQKTIVATHFPFINKHGGYFLKLYQQRSYVLALDSAHDPEGMYIGAGQDGISLRYAHGYLLFGGAGHRTGKSGGGYRELEKLAHRYYPKAEIKYRWATQDCMTLDGIPYIGRYSEKCPDLYVATGFNKWGMTSSMVAALMLKDMILSKKNPYEELYNPSRSVLHPRLLVNTFEAAANMLTFRKPRCPHLGCALRWNREEHSWDCPCHGSRFTEKGELMENPATDDMKI